MSGHYILDGKKPVPCDLMTWAKSFEGSERHIAKSGNRKKKWVSTVFLGLDHQFGDGPPLLFETMIFGGEHDQWVERCSTWDEAEAIHKHACKIAGIKP